MSSMTNDRRGVVVYGAVAITGSMLMAAIMRAMSVSTSNRRAIVLITATMWIPSLARWVATHTVDRGWRPVFPVRRWGAPRSLVVLGPLAAVSAIYLGAYAIAFLAGIPRGTPVWRGAAVFLNIAVNLPLLTAIGGFGALGEECGWRGYLQPRLDQLGVPGSVFWVIVCETLFHVPLIVTAAYRLADTWTLSLALFFALKLGSTPLWTWATYQWGTIWMAIWFHTFHNAVSQVLVPRALGAGSPLVLGESGVLPVALYLLFSGCVLAIVRARRKAWHLPIPERFAESGSVAGDSARAMGEG